MDTQPTTEQAPAASVEDRIASIFGGAPEPEPAQEAPSEPVATEAASEPEQGAEPPPPVEETFEFEVDGEKFQLPKKLEKAVLQERDYTQKSQSLAEQRRTIELQQHQARIAQMGEQFRQEAAQELSDLQMLDQVIKQAQSQDWSALGTDELIRRRLDLDALKERRNSLNESVEKKKQDWARKQQEEIASLRAKSLETIAKKIPGWTEATAKSIREHALSEGYSETELNAILDPRHVTTLWKAQQYDLLKAKATPAAQAAKSVKTTPTTPMPQQVKDKLAFRKEVAKHAPGSAAHQAAVKDRIAKIFG